jgi:hypothetical protein
MAAIRKSLHVKPHQNVPLREISMKLTEELIRMLQVPASLR